jgi:hypothetical protein
MTAPGNVERCPHCGYQPAKEGRAGRFLIWLVAILLCLTGVGVVIGLPLLLYYERLESDAKERTISHS